MLELLLVSKSIVGNKKEKKKEKKQIPRFRKHSIILIERVGRWCQIKQVGVSVTKFTLPLRKLLFIYMNVLEIVCFVGNVS